MAGALLQRGAVREAVALLRGAVARDGDEDECARLLGEVLGGRARPHESAPPITLELVDRWIRRGMLVEALAILCGTPIGSDDTGREWADLLGELLAPVPVDAEPTLRQMHRHLLTGGASLALVILDERAKREPTLPAWAIRRLSLLRWMLLDNAATAERHPQLSEGAPTALATAVREAVNERNPGAALAAARRQHALDPSDPDPPALARAIEAILAEIERHGEEAHQHARTLPMFGHPAARMQLRMGNIAQAGVVYRKLLAKEPGDAHAKEMLDHIEAVLRAVAGEPVAHDSWSADTELHDDLEITSAMPAPDFTHGDLPDHPEIAPLEEDEPTTRTPSAAEDADRLIAEGRLDEAERLLASLAAAFPSEPEWAERLDQLAALRASGVVLVRAIRTVE